MRRVGIITEYNPFHSGHAAQIAAARSRGAQSVAAVMSGSFVQRGSPAVFSKFVRARAALQNGVDLLAELPVPWAAAGADRFAEGGVALLAAMGCDTLCFGAECADAAALAALASLLEDPAFDAALRARHTRGGGSLASLRAALAEAQLPGAAALLAGPNNSLAVAYLRAARRLGLNFEILALPRLGAGHDAPLGDGGAIASAGALRALILAGRFEKARAYLPADAADLYAAELAAGRVLEERAFSLSLLTRLRCMGASDFDALPGAGGEGLTHLLARTAQQAAGAQELYDRLKSKRYTHARLRRLALAAYLGLTDDLPALPPYLRLLGGSERGLTDLPGRIGGVGIPVSQSLAKLARLPGDAGRVAAIEARAGALWSLCLQTPQIADGEFTEKFIRV